MKPIKMLVLAALAALTAMALVGAPSAMGGSTALCKVDPGEGACPGGSLTAHIHGVTEQKMAVLNGLVKVECDVLFLGEVGALGAPQFIEGNFTYTNCGSCTVEEIGGPAVFAILKTGHEKAAATLEWEMHVNCSGSVNCYYDGEGLEGVFKGALLPFVEEGEFGKAELNKVKGLFCPSLAYLDLWLFSLSAFYIGT